MVMQDLESLANRLIEESGVSFGRECDSPEVFGQLCHTLLAIYTGAFLQLDDTALLPISKLLRQGLLSDLQALNLQPVLQNFLVGC